MTRMIIRCCIILFTLFQLQGYGQGNLTIEVTGIKALEGKLYISIYDSESSWLDTDKAFHKSIIPVKHETETFVLPGLQPGEFAIAVFQDLNGNEILDANEMKIPKEPYGFSNNTKGTRGPATFRQAAFVVKDEHTLSIELVNNLFTPNKEKNGKTN